MLFVVLHDQLEAPITLLNYRDSRCLFRELIIADEEILREADEHESYRGHYESKELYPPKLILSIICSFFFVIVVILAVDHCYELEAHDHEKAEAENDE